MRDLDLLSGSEEDDGERLEPRDLAALAGGGEAEADRFARDLVLRTGETEEACADFRLLGLCKETRQNEGLPHRTPTFNKLQSMGAFHYAKISGNFGRNINGTLRSKWKFSGGSPL